MSRKAERVGWGQRLLFGKRVRLTFNPKLGLFIFLGSLPILGLLRFVAFGFDDPWRNIFWVALLSLSFGLLGTFTSYFDD